MTTGQDSGMPGGPALGPVHNDVAASTVLAVQAAVVHGDIHLHAAPEQPPEPEPRGPDNLPAPLADFTGRQEELGLLAERIASGQGALAIHAIDGMGGIGKTALAVQLAHQVAHRYPDGRLFIDLQAHSATDPPVEPAQAMSRLLSALKATPVRTPASTAEWGEVWRAELSRRRVLVVLDNAASTAQVEHLLPGTTDSLVVITSRRRLDGLRTRGLTTHSLDVLPHEAAVSLFTGVVGERRTREDPASADEIVHLCGRLPLAVRLVAARLGARSGWRLADMLAELRDEQTRLAAMRVEDVSVRAAFELSYRWLTDVEQRVFRRLGLHPAGELGLPVAAALGGVPRRVGLEAMERLVDYSLVRETARHRYRMHDLMREYARECASETDSRPDRRRATARALDYYLHTALTAHAALMPHRPIADDVAEAPEQAHDFASEQAAVDWYRLESENLLACRSMASEFDLQSYLWRIPRAMAHYLGLVTRLKDAADSYALGLSLASLSNDRRATADMTARVAEINSARGQHAGAVDGFLGARETYALLGDPVAAADMLNRAGLCHRGNGKYERALETHEHALAEYIALDDRFGQAESHYMIAMVHRVKGTYAAAQEHHGRAIELYRELGYALGEARSLANIGVIHRLHRDYDTALRYYPRALAIYRGTGDQRGIANTLNNMASALDLAGRTDEAFPLLAEAAEIFAGVDSAAGLADVRRVTARLKANTGAYDDAEAELRDALETYRTNRDLFGLGGALAELASVVRRAGRGRDAVDLAREALSVYRDEVSSTSGVVTALAEVARCLHGVGDVDGARAHLAQALPLTAELGDAKAKEILTLLDDLGGRP
ncbi:MULTISPECIES: ATP-binding protein [unclassified Saccharothrix]|uniref:ATP-binding protein n=1 Tax=unclassified Saccharothrix TaxID=2593673 RepID=UPI00307F87AF